MRRIGSYYFSMRLAVLSASLFFFSIDASAQTVVNAASFTNICPDGNYYVIPSLASPDFSEQFNIKESAVGNFVGVASSTRTLILTMPTGFELNPSAGSISALN